MDLQKARDGSLLSKYVAALIIIAGSALVGLGILKITVWDVISVAFSIAALFGTVDINLIMEKVTGRAKGVTP